MITMILFSRLSALLPSPLGDAAEGFLLLLVMIGVFSGQLALCLKAKRLPVKLIPVYYVALDAGAAVVYLLVLAFGVGDAWDLAFALLSLGFAAVPALPVAAAWIAYRLKRKKQTPAAR